MISEKDHKFKPDYKAKMDQVSQLMKNLALSDDPMPVLIETKSNLIATSQKDLQQIFQIPSNLAQIKPIFDLLNTNDNDQILISINILEKILTKHSEISMKLFFKQYLQCLNHPNEVVKIFALKQLNLCSKSEDISIFLQTTHLLRLLVEYLGNSSADIIKICQDILISLCSHPNVPQKIFTAETVAILESVMQKSDSYKFYVYELCVKISGLNDESLKIMVSCGILEQLFSEVTNGDVLTQLNALQLLSDLALTPNGLEFVKSFGIMEKIAYLLFSAKNDQMAEVLLPGLLKFFGHLGSCEPYSLIDDKISLLPEILKLSSYQNTKVDPINQVIAFETVCHIGSTREGKNVLKKFANEVELTLKDFFSHVSKVNSDAKIRLLDALAKLFFVPVDEQTEDISSLLELWFDQLSTDTTMTMTNFFNMMIQPFSDLLSACLTVIYSVSTMPWGVAKIVREPGFVEWLLNRTSCAGKPNKELRFAIVNEVKNKSASSVVRDILGEEILLRVNRFCREGPFYVDVATHVAFEK